MRRRRTYVIVGFVTAITSMAVGIGRDDSGESQKNQSDLEFKIISYTFPFSFNIFLKTLICYFYYLHCTVSWLTVGRNCAGMISNHLSAAFYTSSDVNASYQKWFVDFKRKKVKVMGHWLATNCTSLFRLPYISFIKVIG